MEGVFCAENLLELLQVGGQGPGDSVAAFLLPYLQRGDFRVVAEATPAEIEACRRLLPGLLDVFQLLPVPTFTDTEAIEVLNRVANASASAARCKLEPGVVALVLRLFQRFQPYAALPGPAANFLRLLCDQPPRRDAVKEPLVTNADVVAQFVKQTGLPEIFLRDELPLALDDVRGRFDAQIIGQPEATLAAARLVTTVKAGLTDPGGRWGFCCSAGRPVSEKRRWPKAWRILLRRGRAKGPVSAPGYERVWRLGSRHSPALRLRTASRAPWIERVRRQPFCILLFDEIEKAAPEVFDVLLGLLDEGRLTGRYGRVTNFRSAIVILTSNLGSSAAGVTGFGSDAGPNYEAEVGEVFSAGVLQPSGCGYRLQILDPARSRIDRAKGTERNRHA